MIRPIRKPQSIEPSTLGFWPPLAEVIDGYINEAVAEFGPERAARVLGVNPSTIRRRRIRKRAQLTTVPFPGADNEGKISPELHIWALQRLQEQRLDAEIASWRQWYKDLGRSLPVGA